MIQLTHTPRLPTDASGSPFIVAGTICSLERSARNTVSVRLSYESHQILITPESRIGTSVTAMRGIADGRVDWIAGENDWTWRHSTYQDLTSRLYEYHRRWDRTSS